MWHGVPYLECHLHAGGAGVGGEAGGVVEQDLGLAGLDEYRWKTMEIGIERGGVGVTGSCPVRYQSAASLRPSGVIIRSAAARVRTDSPVFARSSHH